MAYGMQQLRKAGQALGDMDKAYTDAVRKVPAFNNIGAGVPLNELTKYPYETDNWKERRMIDAMTGVVATANVASRYALPAGGLTLAGKGLYDLTVGMQQTDGTIMPQ